MLPDEPVVRKMRISGQHAIDFLHLSRTQLLVRIQAPAAGEQPLTSKDLVNPGDAARELVGRIEQRRVDVGQLRAEREQLAKAWRACRASPLRRACLAEALRKRDAVSEAAARQRTAFSRSTALLVHTAHWPSRPPEK